MSLVLTFLCTTNHAKALTFDGTFDFQTKLVRMNEIGLESLDKTMKFFFTENEPTEDKDQILKFVVLKDKCTKLSEDTNLSRSSISKLIRLRRKLRFQEDR